MKHTIIFNPASNSGKSIKTLQQIRRFFNRDPILTKHIGHATEIVQDLSEEIETIVVCGGDGTLSEVAQGLYDSGKNTIMLAIPTGSGNDFIKNIPEMPRGGAPFSSPDHTLASADIGEVEFHCGDRMRRRIFINSMGFGLTGLIASHATKAKAFLQGDAIYVYALLKTALFFKGLKATVSYETDEGRYHIPERVYFAMCIGNGRCEGGTFQITPRAKINDGLLDLCLLDHISLWTLPVWIWRFMRGTHLGKKGITYVQVKSLQVEFQGALPAHFDGEVIEGLTTRLAILVRPLTLNVVWKTVNSLKP